MTFNDNALTILTKRYLLPGETPDDLLRRVTFGNEDYYNLLANLDFLPNSPTLFNAGTDAGTLSACFKFDVPDSMEGIMDVARKAAMVQKWGGGVGYVLSELRPRGAPVATTHRNAGGPVQFMKLYHAIAEAVTQGGKRDGAQMAILDCYHPDIREFIHCKDEDPQRLSTFNISVALHRDFMERALLEDQDEHALLWEMAESAWKTGDPGCYFIDTAEFSNPTPWLGQLTGTNPCLTGDTKILTVYEGAVPFEDLAKRGTDVLVYAWNPYTKLPVVRRMRQPRMTRKDVEVLEVEFDSGLKVRCTPDHNFRTFRGNKIEAQELEVGQSVRAFSISKHRDGHLRAHGWKDNKAQHQWVSRMIWECYNGPVPQGMLVHHVNHDETDNRIENLTIINPLEHNREHYPNRLQNGFYCNETREAALARNHKVVAVRPAGRADVYNGTVDDVHTYIIADPEPVSGMVSGIVSQNCGEVCLLDNEPCNLGSINLSHFVDLDLVLFDWLRLEKTVRTATRYLDTILDNNQFPDPAITDAALTTRKLGLGVMGWADALALMGIHYDTEEAVNLGSRVMSFINRIAFHESVSMAEEKGVAPCFEGRGIVLRNATRTCIAPTGTISILAGASSGIEPHFALEWTREMGDGTLLQERIPVLDQTDFRPKTAMEIAPEWHIKHQAAFQRHTDLAVSKTINLPNSATVQDIYDAYVMMWQMGCKGGTVYRDGSRSQQVLTTATDQSVPEQQAVTVLNGRRRLPDDRPAINHKFTVGEVEGYLTVGMFEDGDPGEMFIRVSKEGSTINGLLDTIGILTSLLMQYGADLDGITRKLSGVAFEPSGMTRNPTIPTASSIVDYVFRYIGDKFGDGVSHMKSGALCPECGNMVVFQEGCVLCAVCGWSRC